MKRDEAISILKNAAFLSTETKYQAIGEAVDKAIEALRAQDVPDTNDGDMISKKAVLRVLTDIAYNSCKTEGQAQVIDWAKTLVCVMPSAQPETCEGCKHLNKWENEVEYGYTSPCTRCKRRTEDNYER